MNNYSEQLGKYQEDTIYGRVDAAFHSNGSEIFYVCFKANFIGEYYEDDDLEKAWMAVNAYEWEEIDNFHETEEEIIDYLAFCVQDITVHFNYRIDKAVTHLMGEAQVYYKNNQASPTLEWLLEHYPRLTFTRSTAKFKHRVIAIVLQNFQNKGQQLSLF